MHTYSRVILHRLDHRTQLVLVDTGCGIACMSESMATLRTLGLNFTSDPCLFRLGKGVHLSGHLPSHTHYHLLLRAERGRSPERSPFLFANVALGKVWPRGLAGPQVWGGRKEARPCMAAWPSHSKAWLRADPSHLKFSDPNCKNQPQAPHAFLQPSFHSGEKAHQSHDWA